ncbi:MAG: hypothetical protein Q8Q09_05045 [Deltaproteobacteria bacterium]|nr:hypothetical protein [Deltaproteobacteria bacterium]
MQRFLLRALTFALMYFTLAACSGGGCGGSAIPPIRGGFPLPPTVPADRRIPHAIQVRLTDQGLRSVEAIGPSLLGGFLGEGIPVPTSTQDLTVGKAIICPANNCRITVRIATTVAGGGRGFELSFAPPEAIRLRIRLILSGTIPLQACTGSCSDRCGGTFCLTIASPNLVLDTNRGARPYIGMQTAIRISRDMRPGTARNEYFRADLVAAPGATDSVSLVPGEDIEDADISCGSSWVCGIVNLFKSTLIGQIRGQLSSAVAPIQSALAHASMPDPPGCPTGSTRDADRCLYAGSGTRESRLVPLLLGTDGEGNFGSLLNSITPGIRAPNRFVVAAGDPAHGAEVSAAGATINVFGAFESMRQAACVPTMAPPPMPTVPEYMALRSNMIPGTSTTTDLGIGVSEEFLNNMFWNWWNSGMFCLGITSRLSQQVSAGLLIAIPSLSTLRNAFFPATNAAIAISFRPQTAPTVTVGGGSNLMTDPLLTITFRQLSLDFFVWSEERYVRIFTLTSNLSIPMNLTPGATGLQPALGSTRVENAVVTNVALINTQPTQLAELLQDLLGSVIMQFAGSLPAVNLPSIPLPGGGGAMINIQIPATGVRGVTEGSSRFMGIFANLRCTGGMCPRMNTATVDPTLRATVNAFDPAVLRFDGHYTREAAPTVRLAMGVRESFGRDVEYRFRVDGGSYSEWTRTQTLDARSPMFSLQGHHRIDVVARIAGEIMSESADPATADIVIDADGPNLFVERRGNEIVALAHDAVTPDHAIQYSFVWDGQPATAWSHLGRVSVPRGADHIRARARDEAGHISESAIARDPLTIRGGPSTDVSGCGCRTAGHSNSSNTGLLAVASAAAIAGLFARRRRALVSPDAQPDVQKSTSMLSPKSARTLIFWGTMTLFFAGMGCNCGDGDNPDRRADASIDAPADAQSCMDGARMCALPMMNRCVPRPECPACDPGFMAGGEPTFDEATCMWRTMNACTCEPLPPLAQGMAGSHLDLAVATDGTAWLSSYSAGDPFTRKPYGDLVVGRWNQAMSRVDWTHVDGVPAGGTVGGAVTGWRAGIETPGPDVGRWNSIALDAMSRPRVAYWDTTNDKLKFAAFDGSNWTTHVVDEGGDNGRYASLAMLPGAIPMIAYRAMVTNAMGAVATEVRVARASSANPTRAADWTVTRVFTAPSMCRASDCAMGQTCTITGTCITPSAGCAMPCAAGKVCNAMNACVDAIGANYVEDFVPGALFTSLAVDAMGRGGLVFYNRDRGNLHGVAFDGTMWGMPFPIVGEAAMADTGDFGAWATLAIAADGVWHVAYVDAYDEALNYVRVQNGRLMGMPEVIDDGGRVGMTVFDDGKHIVGDSAQLVLDAMGNPRVVYQDSSAGTLRLATRSMTGWTTQALDTMAHTGYWARLKGNRVATFFRDMRAANTANRFGVRVTMAP